MKALFNFFLPPPFAHAEIILYITNVVGKKTERRKEEREGKKKAFDIEGGALTGSQAGSFCVWKVHIRGRSQAA